jgi:tRNA A37 methylthiotransferase MiaB
MKIKFCSHSNAVTTQRGKVGVNPAYFFLKKWYELHGKNSDVVWLDPGMIILDSIDIVVKNIVQEQPDVLGLGVYIWNIEFQYQLAKEVKRQLPNTIIVLGGPSLDVHKDFDNNNHTTDFFKEYSYVDYVVYGDGEKPFQQIIDYHGGFITDKNNFVNIIENNQGQGKCYPYEVLDDALYLSQSPFASQEDVMVKLRDNLFSQGLQYYQQMWGIEFARGCMYSCTFCDWSQNLTKKVKRRTHDWKADIDLFHKLNVPIRETDANFGQWPDDIKAFDYAISLFDPARTFSFVPINTPKLKKDVTEYLLKQSGLIYNVAPKIAIQDPMEDVLLAINRPSVSWEDISKMVLNLRDALPPSVFVRTEMQTILGLPEQTVQSVVESLIKFYEIGVLNATYFLWVILPNSPAADLDYQKRWGLKTKTVYQVTDHIAASSNRVTKRRIGSLDLTELKFESLGDLYYQVSQQKPGADQLNFLKSEIVVEHKKMTTADMWAVHMIKNKWTAWHKQFKIQSNVRVKKMLVKLRDDSIEESIYQYDLHKEFIDRYNFIIWAKYDPVNNTLSSF